MILRCNNFRSVDIRKLVFHITTCTCDYYTQQLPFACPAQIFIGMLQWATITNLKLFQLRLFWGIRTNSSGAVRIAQAIVEQVGYNSWGGAPDIGLLCGVLASLNGRHRPTQRNPGENIHFTPVARAKSRAELST